MDVDSTHYLTYPTWKKNIILSSAITQTKIKDKRNIFALLRNTRDSNAFLPAHGYTAGTFCLWQILSENRRPKRSASG